MVLAEYHSNLDSHCNGWDLAKDAYFGGTGGRAPNDCFIRTR